MSTRNRIHADVDVAIVGGGIAGVWLANLRRALYSALLIERRASGAG